MTNEFVQHKVTIVFSTSQPDGGNALSFDTGDLYKIIRDRLANVNCSIGRFTVLVEKENPK